MMNGQAYEVIFQFRVTQFQKLQNNVQYSKEASHYQPTDIDTSLFKYCHKACNTGGCSRCVVTYAFQSRGTTSGAFFRTIEGINCTMIMNAC